MARKKGLPIGEEGRKWLREHDAIDDRYSYAPEGMVAKQKRNIQRRLKRLRGEK